MLLFYIMLFFSNSELNPRSVSCQTNRIWKNIFIDNFFNANILNMCTSKRTQLQQKLEMSVSSYFELILFVCIDVLRRCQHFLQPWRDVSCLPRLNQYLAENKVSCLGHFEVLSLNFLKIAIL